MQYQLAFSYFVGQKPNGWTNLLLATVCLFIPAIGPIVLFGYIAVVTERLIRDPDLRKHPDFAFDRFTDLLTRGIWPFLVQLVGTFVMIPVVVVALVGPMMLGGALNQPAVGIGVGFLLYTVALFSMSALLMPMAFHAELANRFDLGGAFRFTMSFLKLVGGKALVAYLVYSLLSIPVVLLGFLLCIVGVYPATVLLMMAAQHLMVQLYREYLDRGGEEIVKTEKRRRRRYEDEDDEPEEYDIDDDRKRRD